MSINAIKGFHEYLFDSAQQEVIRDDNVKINCFFAAKKLHNFALKKFSFFSWIKFFLIDLIAYIPWLKRHQYKVLKEELIPELNNKAREVNEFVKKYYYCTFKTVNHIEDSKIILLGETHISLGHRSANARLFDLFSGNKDLLLEEYDNLEKKPCNPVQLAYLNPNKKIILKGWDITSLPKYNFAIEVFITTCYTQIISIFFIPFNKVNYILFLLSFYLNHKYGSWLASKDSIIERNNNMHILISENYNLFKKIFVIAGSRHYRHSDKEVDSHMHNFLKNKASIILIPKKKTFFYSLFHSNI